MAVVNTKSTAVTNGDSTQPHLIGSPWIQSAGVWSAVGTVEVAAADDNGSVYRMVRVPSGARIQSVCVMSDAIAGGTSFDVGLYDVANVSAGAVVDADFFAAGLDLSSGNTVPVDVAFGNAIDISKIEQRIWEVLALAKDPFKMYDICLTGNTVGTGAGTISLRVEWVV